MALQTHERIDTYVAAKRGSAEVRAFKLGGPETLRQMAERMAREGHENVRIVTERVTWRGKNGKRSYEILSEEHVG